MVPFHFREPQTVVNYIKYIYQFIFGQIFTLKGEYFVELPAKKHWH